MKFNSTNAASSASVKNGRKTLPFLITLFLFGLFAANAVAQSIIYTANFGAASVNAATLFTNSGVTWTRSGAQAANWQVATASAGSFSVGTSGMTSSASANLADGTASPAIGTAVVTADGIVTTGFTSVQFLFGARKTAAYTGAITIEWSNDGTVWNIVPAYTDTPNTSTWTIINAPGTNASWITLPVGAENQANLRFRITSVRANTSGNYRIDDFTVRGVSATPSINVSGSVGSFFTPQGTPSDVQSFNVSGSNLTADILVSAPAGYEVSDGGPFGSSVSLTQTLGVVNSTTIDVRLTGVSSGEFSGNVASTSTGATTQNVAVSGFTYAPTAAFTPGNIAVVQVGLGPNGIANGTAAPLYIREYSNAGAYVQSIAVPVNDNGGNQTLTISNSAASDGGLTLSENGQYLSLVGYDAPVGTANVTSTTAAANNRIVGYLVQNGTINTSTRINDGFSTNNVRGAVTENGSGFWIGGAGTGGGIRYAVSGSTGASTLISNTASNYRIPQIFGGQLYTSGNNAPIVGIATVGTGLPTTTGQTATLVPTLTQPTDAYSYVFLDRDLGVAGNDVLYISNNSTLNKYSFDGATWTSRGTLTGTNISGLCGAVNGASADLYATNGTNLVKLVDAAAFNADITGNGTALTTAGIVLATAPTNTFFRGVAFAPNAAPQCVFYQDNDGDTYGSAVTTLAPCGPPPGGYVAISGDCNDAIAAINPGATENPCNGVDDDCDGSTDEGFVAGCNDNVACNYNPLATCATGCDYTNQTYYFDGDTDTYGGTTTQSACVSPGAGWVLIGGDCDDANAAINPGAAEIACNGIDDNCVGGIDEGSVLGCTNINATNYNPLAICDDGSCIVPTSFGAGNVVALRVGTGAAVVTSSGTRVQLDQITPAGVLVNTFTLPSTGSSRLVESASASSEGQMTLSADGTSVVIAGYDANGGQVNVGTTAGINRVVGVVDAAFTYARPIVSTNTFFTGNNFRSATRAGNDYWGAGTTSGGIGGINFFGTSAAPANISVAPATNTRVVNTYDGDLYYSNGSGTRGIYKVGTGLPTAGPITAILEFTTGASSSPYAFQFNDAHTVCYVGDDQLGTAGGVLKYVFSAGVWSLQARFVMGATWGAPGVYVDFYSEQYPVVYAVVRDNSVVNVTKIVRFSDDGTGSGNVTPTLTDLATAPANTFYRAVQPAPCNGVVWYRDLDGDGYGDLATPFTYCSQPYGFVANSTDCDDNDAARNPGVADICGNGIDDDCDGLTDETCAPSNIPNDNFVSAQNTSLAGVAYPGGTCFNGTLVGAAVSAEGNSANVLPGGGQDVWYKVVAISSALRIVTTTSSMNVVLELHDAATVQLDVENDVAGVGGEIMTTTGLTEGATYYIAVRSYNGTQGTFNICVQALMDSRCNDGSGVYNLCSNFKPTWTGANSYTFNFVPTLPTPGAPTSVTGSGQIPLSNPTLALQHGGTYDATINTTYNLLDGAGNQEVVVIPGTDVCAVTIAPHANVEVKLGQRCPAVLQKGSVLQGKPFVCAATSFTVQFTQVTDCTGATTNGFPFTVNTTGAASNLSLNFTVPQALLNNSHYRVEWRPNFAYGPGTYGSPQVIFIGGSNMDIVNMNTTGEERNAIVTEAALYPNPTNGDVVNINLVNVESDVVNVRIMDGTGRVIYTNRFVVEGSLNTNIHFEQTLANGLYLVEFTSGTEVITERMMVQK